MGRGQNDPASQPRVDRPRVDGVGQLQALREALFAKQIPLTELWRTYYGSSVDMNRIEQAIRGAEVGMMRPLTDLSVEMIDRDAHWATLIQKRFGALRGLDWDIVPASGPGINPERAKMWADVCRDQINRLPRFRKRIYQLAFGMCHGRAALEHFWEGPTYGPVRWRIKGMGWIHPRRISFGPEREFRIVDGLYQTSYFPAIGEALRQWPHKFTTFQAQIFNEYPEREGLGPRSLYWAFFKRFGVVERNILTELFGKPWRIIEGDSDAPAGQKEDIAAADIQIANLGGNNIARLPRGYKLNVKQPSGENGGKIHKDVIEYSDQQLSKLWVGQDSTTDAKPMGLGSKQSEVHEGQQLQILKGDAWDISEDIEDWLIDSIVVLNSNEEELSHAPSFMLIADPATNKTEEVERLGKTVGMGLPVALEEAYEVTGYRQPRDDEARLELSPAPGETQPRPVVVYPQGAAPGVGQTSGTPASPTATPAGHGLAPPPAPSDEPPQNDALADAAPAITPALDTDPLAITQSLRPGHAQALERAGILFGYDPHLFARQPATVHGSPESIIDRGIDQASEQTGKLAEAMADAAEKATDPKA